jgi:parallel beta-helix repeat protein
MEDGDTGTIYIGRDWTERGNVIRNNYIHAVSVGGDVSGIYLDDLSSGVLVERNIIVGMQRGVDIGGGRDNIVDNNIFLNCITSVSYTDRGAGPAMQFAPQLLTKLKNVPYRDALWRQRYPGLFPILEDEPFKPKGNMVKNNLSCGAEFLTVRLHGENNTAPPLNSNNVITTDQSMCDRMMADRIRGIGLGLPAPAIARHLSKLSPTAVRLLVANEGNTLTSGTFDIWLSPESAASLRSPREIQFSLRPGERREFVIEVVRATPVVVGAELRGEDLRPDGILLP